MGYENEILGLMQKMVNKLPRDKNKGILPELKCERELRKLECTINYDGHNSKRGGGGRDRGNLPLK